MYIPITLCLTKETKTILKKQAEKLNLSQSALVRLLLIQNEKTMGEYNGPT
jgi:hypothetical protein